MIQNDLTVRIGGEAGMGLRSSGAGFSLALTRGGLYVFGEAEYHSRIRGGHNYYTIRAAPQPLYALAEPVHILLALDRATLEKHTPDVVAGGAVIYERDQELPDELQDSDVNFFPLPLAELAEEEGGAKVMRNTLALGVAAGLMGFDTGYMEGVIEENFAGKGQEVVDANRRVLQAGVEASQPLQADFDFRLEAIPDAPKRIVLNGNQAFSLGALAGGCRLVAGYPMTPGSGVLHWFAAHAEQYGTVLKHAEDEIAAINMAIGAGFVGVRAMVPTSGGGFALMSEGLGLAGITETPVVIYEAQRPGPATGLPTRTEQGDLLFVTFASQGEFPRFVLAPGTVEESFRAGWQAFNLAETYQTPVLVLSDHYLAVSARTLDRKALDFDQIEIERGELLTGEGLDDLRDYRRYQVTDSGVSPRAVPGHPKAVYVSTGNEHDEYGAISEDPDNRNAQVEKRMRKLQGMARELDGLAWYGPKEADTTFVCWGSTYGPLREAVDRLNDDQPGRANMLHFSMLHPFPVGAIEALEGTKRTVVVEQNATGQLEFLIRAHTGRPADGIIHKYDGRAFTPEYIQARVPEEG